MKILECSPLSCCLWTLPESDVTALPKIANLGLTHIDFQPHMLTTPAAQRLVQQLGLQVTCLGASFDMLAGANLDSAEETLRRAALDHLSKAFAHGAARGATTAYVVPGKDPTPSALERYGQSLRVAADAAASHGLKLCVEHFPGWALPTARGTLSFLADLAHPNLYLLLDLGHLQISQESPADIVKLAGDRLGYVHLDDNDGINDLHWSLCEGVMTEDSLRDLFDALAEIKYTGPVSLELSPNLPDPLAALESSLAIVQRL